MPKPKAYLFKTLCSILVSDLFKEVGIRKTESFLLLRTRVVQLFDSRRVTTKDTITKNKGSVINEI